MRVLPGGSFLGLHFWQWVFFCGIVVVAYVVAFVLTWALAFLVQRWKSGVSQQLAR